MAVLLPFLAVAVFLAMWWSRRGSTLTRDCRWRLDRRLGPTTWHCATCGATCDPGSGTPRDCLHPAPRDPA
ncbi:hypothetical protein [Neotabrizicola shimadae]|uniref:Uncharacterized protein n=1 Tax=Neotabrizicola shimadae TaxID=2807096 RepID=A0A8G1EAL1_9RHOB|nr:hypothetical protein [Neotabrizicola shimadae]QYZ68725.1 hypothetical protein JO391_13220 [Neotabrizicola shimadae]